MSRGALVWASRQWGPFTTRAGDPVEPKAADQLILLVLADLADHNTQECFPSRNYLEARTRLSRGRIGQALQLWVDVGLVRVVTRYGQHGRQTSNSYKLAMHHGKKEAGAGASPRAWKPVDYPVDKSRQGDPVLDPPTAPTGDPNSDPLDPSSNHQKRIGGDPVPVDGLEDLEKESPAGMDEGAPEGAKRVSQVESGDAGLEADGGPCRIRPSREYLLENLRRVREKTKT